jgi:hypothetical protein
LNGTTRTSTAPHNVPDAVAFDGGVEIAAAAVLLEEGVEVSAQVSLR